MKKQKTQLQKFDKRIKLSKIFSKIAPIVFIVFAIISAVLLFFGFARSFGNIAEIISKLNSKHYTGEELQANYNFLIEKYGEWVIGKGNTGFVVRFIDIKKAVFSGIAILSMIGSGVAMFISLFCGKYLFPLLAKKFKDDSENQANRQTIELAEKIEKMEKEKE